MTESSLVAGEAVYYYDGWFEKASIGLIMDVEETGRYGRIISYKIFDSNNEVSVGEYENDNFISIRSEFIAPLTCYNSMEEFLDSRGISKKGCKHGWTI